MNKEIILTLDAGGTNFVFSAMRNYEEIIPPVSLPSNAHDLNLCLNTLIEGFKTVRKMISDEAAAISFAFPGPADYRAGIIGKLNNLPAFKGGVALGPMLKEEFKVPVFINNDGDLFALGESINGFLPFVNEELKKRNIEKKFKNLLGVTLGTGFGAGIVINGKLLTGDNSNGAEIWLMRDGISCNRNAEEGISIRAIKRKYALFASLPFESAPEPADIHKIAEGDARGNKEAALKAFEIFGANLGEALANAATLIDGMIVLGGGISKAFKLFMPSLIKQMNSTYAYFGEDKLPRLAQEVFPLIGERDINEFSQFKIEEITVPRSNTKIKYNSSKRIGVGISKLGTSRAVSIGAYAFAIRKLNIDEN